jgi:hypothetical protein
MENPNKNSVRCLFLGFFSRGVMCLCWRAGGRVEFGVLILFIFLIKILLLFIHYCFFFLLKTNNTLFSALFINSNRNWKKETERARKNKLIIHIFVGKGLGIVKTKKK